MLAESDKDRSYHSEDKRRSMSREEARQYKLEKVKLRFKNIATRIKQIKKQNNSDLNHLNSLKKGSENIEKMAHQSLQKATLFLSESKLQRKRVLSPPYQDNKHPQIIINEFGQLPLELSPAIGSPRGETLKKKRKNGKGSVNGARTKTDQTSESQVQKASHIEKIAETELIQQSSALEPEQSSKFGHEPTQIMSKVEQQQARVQEVTPKNQPSNLQKQIKLAEYVRRQRQSYGNSSLVRQSGRKFISTQGSLGGSLGQSNQMVRKKGSQSIYPYIATIIVSILLLLLLRG